MVGAESLPTAEQILDRYIEVTGGKAAHEKIRTEIMRATTEVKAQGISGPTETYRDGTNYYLVMEVPGAGKVEYGAYKGIIWENSALMGPRIKTGAEKAFYEREAVLEKDLRWRDVYAKAELAGELVDDGVASYKVILTPKDGGKPETRFYDKATGLLRKIQQVAPSPMGEIPAEQILMDYKDFGGVKVPTRSITKMASAEMSVTVTSLEFNRPIPASKFVPPKEILALAEKQPAKAPAKK